MSKTVIKIENLSKIYRLGEVGTGTISHDLNRWWKMNILGQEDPYAMVGHVNDRTAKAEKGEMVAALRDINLEVKEGEVLGIIGKNGAGKSTLLKILSRVTSPTTGSVKVSGRMASLLEVGTGFHPDMTGRENIYMNGTIMGMRKWEITQKLDEIVEFAGVAKYLDTPVKRYSSGMTVRLGFAIAAHLEPEILIVDEVLAVGDAEFQKKAIGKMQDVSTNDGRTVLFVSHNMGSIKTLCNRGILLRNGSVDYNGNIDDAVSKYLQTNSQEGISLIERTDRYGNGNFIFTGIEFADKFDRTVENILSGDSLKIKLAYKTKIQIDKAKLIIGINIRDEHQNNIVTFLTDEMERSFINNTTNETLTLEIPKLMLRGSNYSIRLFAAYNNTMQENICDSIENAATLNVIATDLWNAGKPMRSDKTAIIEAKYSN
jgi:lipopolysaccharide transport system ATP-binding protein